MVIIFLYFKEVDFKDFLENLCFKLVLKRKKSPYFFFFDKWNLSLLNKFFFGFIIQNSVYKMHQLKVTTSINGKT